MYDLLVQQGVAKALMGKSKQPYNMTNDEWTEMDERALSAIRLCLADDVLFNIVSEKIAAGLWKNLEKLYMKKSLTNRILRKQKLYNLQMKEGTSITDHLNAFNTLLVQLESIEVKFELEDKAITLLCLLPESWDHIVTSISLSSSETLEFDDVVSSLLFEETRRRLNLETSTSEAMMVRGHLKKDCWKRQQTSKEDSSTEKKEANTKDTGSTSGSENGLRTYKSINDGVVYMGNDVTCNIVGIGSIQLQMFDGTTKILTDVRHVPKLRKKLISLGALDTNGYKIVIQGGVMKIYKGILLVMKAKKVGNLFQLEGRTGSDHVSMVSEHDSCSIRLWHQRLGHMSERGSKILADHKLLPNLKYGKLDFCKHCLFGKQSKQKFKTGKHTSKRILDYIHSDVWGPSPTTSYGGSSYFISFIDDFSRKVWVYMLKRKSGVFTVFKQFRALVENITSRTIKCLRNENGGEFTSKEFENYCKDSGIERHKTIVYTPPQNGVAECMNISLLERARSMLSNAGLQKELWTEAMATACYVINRSPSMAIGCKIPQENPTTHKIIINRDVKFNESSLVQLDVDNKLKLDDVSDFQHIQFETTSNDSLDEHSSDASHEQVSDSDHEQSLDVDHEQVSDADHEEVPTDGSQPIVEAPETSLRRSARIKRPPKRYDDYVTSVAFTANDDEPLCY
eukprot:PITA_32927